MVTDYPLATDVIRKLLGGAGWAWRKTRDDQNQPLKIRERAAYDLEMVDRIQRGIDAAEAGEPATVAWKGTPDGDGGEFRTGPDGSETHKL